MDRPPTYEEAMGQSLPPATQIGFQASPIHPATSPIPERVPQTNISSTNPTEPGHVQVIIVQQRKIPLNFKFRKPLKFQSNYFSSPEV
jgi:hypothetical protein